MAREWLIQLRLAVIFCQSGEQSPSIAMVRCSQDQRYAPSIVGLYEDDRIQSHPAGGKDDVEEDESDSEDMSTKSPGRPPQYRVSNIWGHSGAAKRTDHSCVQKHEKILAPTVN